MLIDLCVFGKQMNQGDLIVKYVTNEKCYFSLNDTLGFVEFDAMTFLD